MRGWHGNEEEGLDARNIPKFKKKKKASNYYQGRIKEKEEPEIISDSQSQMLVPLVEVRSQKRVVICEAED